MKIALFILCIFCWTFSTAQFYNGSGQKLGKNRVQYNQFFWKEQDFQRFKMYYYTGEEDLVEYSAKSINREIMEMERFFDFKLDDHLDIIVYSTKAKFNQSNIGLTQENEDNVGGLTKIVGSKAFIYFEGDHEKLNTQIKAIIAEIMLKKMLFGGNWKDILKANAFASFPKWYIDGFVSFLSHDWDADMESRVKDGVLIGRFDDFSRLDGDEATYAGHALWYYIEQTFGKNVIPNIMYVSRITRNPNRGFESVLGKTIKELAIASANFYKTSFYNDLALQREKKGTKIDFHYRKNRDYYGFKVSPDEQKIAFVENNLGHYRVIIQNLKTGKRDVIYRAEAKLDRSIDKTFPVLTWHPSGEALSFINERKGELRLHIYTLADKKIARKTLSKLEKVLSMDYSEDGKQILFSGVNFGQTDLYLYQVAGNYSKQITNDIWDDIDARFINHSQEIIFSSNRTNDSLYKANINIEPFTTNFDLFTVKVDQLDKRVVPLKRITNTPFANERQAQEISPTRFSFLSEENGLYNRYFADQDSIVSFIDTAIHYRYFSTISVATNLVTSIHEEVYLPKQQNYISLIFQNFRYKLYQFSENEMDSSKIQDIHYKQQQKLSAKRIEENIPIIETKTDTLSSHNATVEIKNYEFGNENYSKKQVILGENNTSSGTNTQESITYNPFAYRKPLEKLYKVNFARDYLSTQLDNQFMNNAYQRYYGPGSVYFNPKLSALTKIGFSDVFEDIKLVGGFRLPLNLNSWEFLGTIQFLKKRLDHELMFYRQSYTDQNQLTGLLTKKITHIVNYRISYPFSETFSFRGNMMYRHDKQVFLSMDNASLERASDKENQAGATVAFVFDNSHTIQENIWEGAKFKIFAEYLNQFSPNKGMVNLGLDLRYSIKLVKNLVWFNRVATATSLGQQKLVYFMGGVDNWLVRPNPSFNQNITVDPNQNFAYQTLATPMRGFIQNSRNGNSFFVWNTEFRLPVFAFFSKYPVRNQFLRNFQLIAFGDLGSAWTGHGPYSPDNYFNTQTINDKPIVIKVQNSREPIIFGFGGGIRMKLFGYFMRFDLGWGVENGNISKRPRLQFSLAYDL